MRRLVVALLVLVTAFVVVDRLAAVAAERVVAMRIQQDQSLAHRPDVSITGFPFLTQLVRGHYDRVDVTVHGVHSGALHVSRAVAHLSDVTVPLSAVVRQRVDRVPVSRAAGEVDLDYADVNRLLADQHLRLSRGTDGRVHVTATVAGIQVDGEFPLTIEGSDLTVALPAGLTARIPLPGLPFGIRITSVRAERGGIVVRGVTSGFVLHP